MGFLGFNFDLEEQLAFYGAYHRHTGNKLIHFFFVPLIFWTSVLWFEYLPPVSDRLDLPAALSSILPSSIANLFVLNWTMVITSIYGLYYITLEMFAGSTWFLFTGIPTIMIARLFYLHVPFAWAIAIGVHILSWVMQVTVGHQWLEHRRPALLDSFFQSLVLAGLFAWMEGLFALGYRPKLQAELEERIDARVKAMDKLDSARQPLVKPEEQ